MLTENDLIVYDKPSGKFTTSDKGYQFLKGYEDLSKLIGPIATIIAKEETDSSSIPNWEASKTLTVFSIFFQGFMRAWLQDIGYFCLKSELHSLMQVLPFLKPRPSIVKNWITIFCWSKFYLKENSKQSIIEISSVKEEIFQSLFSKHQGLLIVFHLVYLTPI